MHVLVTRPYPAGEMLVQSLQRNGIDAYHTPLITFSSGRELERLADDLAELNDGDLLFVVSQNAVEFASQQLRQNNILWPSHLRYFAIGYSSAKALKLVTGQPVTYPQGREISEHLIELEQLQNISGKQALILRGNGGRNLLANTLQLRGATVKFCECYQRHAISYDGQALVKQWQDHQIDTLLVTSGEMLEQLYHLVPEHYRDWLTNHRLVVVSERMANIAHKLGWQSIYTAATADNTALLTTLRSII